MYKQKHSEDGKHGMLVLTPSSCTRHTTRTHSHGHRHRLLLCEDCTIQFRVVRTLTKQPVAAAFCSLIREHRKGAGQGRTRQPEVGENRTQKHKKGFMTDHVQCRRPTRRKLMATTMYHSTHRETQTHTHTHTQQTKYQLACNGVDRKNCSVSSPAAPPPLAVVAAHFQALLLFAPAFHVVAAAFLRLA